MASIGRPTGEDYRQVASYGFSPNTNAFMNTHPIRGARVGRRPHRGGRRHRSYSRCAGRSGIRLSERSEASAAFGPCSVFRSCAKASPIGVIVLHARRSGLSPTSRSSWSTTFADQAVIAIENVRLFDEVQARTRELTEALEQQTATSEVLSVISSSPGELEPVFQAMLENATRICEAKFGNLFLYETATRSASPRCTTRRPRCDELRRREPVVVPDPRTPLGAWPRPSRSSISPT